MLYPITVAMTVAESQQRFDMTVSENIMRFPMTTQELVSIGVPEYDGPYELTPSSTAQTLGTEGLKMTQNVIINPIPSNYGRITYNGSILTVS